MQKQPKERPVYAGCRVHSFCEVCLKQWVSKFPMKTMAPCPVCREKFSALSSRKFKVDEQCEKKLCAFVVDACPCKMAFRLSEYREHVATCAAHKELREAAAKAMEEARRRGSVRALFLCLRNPVVLGEGRPRTLGIFVGERFGEPPTPIAFRRSGCVHSSCVVQA